MKTKHICRFLLACLLAPVVSQPAFAQSTTFTYQGRLTENGVAANGSNDLTFTLYDAASGGATVGVSNVVKSLAVTNGLFTVTLDFGAGFDGRARWLEIAVRPGASAGDYTNLIPRQPITSTPYAIRASNLSGTVAASQIAGIISSNNIGVDSIAPGSISGAMLAAGAVGSNQLAAGAVTTSALANGAVTAAKVATASNWFAVTLANPSPYGPDSFGYSVAAIGSDRLLIGAYRDAYGDFPAGGVAHLFSTNGTLLSIFVAGSPVGGDRFGWSVAA
ncbi:MAG: hypothetical protein H7X97_01450, partial [Opitutaceae bacterium]|nr:hypothetical protein [Verrucomicrobiales bacterium]